MPTGKKLTDEQIKEFLACLRAGATMEHAAHAIGCKKRALEVRAQKNPDFKEEIKNARAISNSLVQRSVFRMATAGNNITAAIFWLVNRDPIHWRRDPDNAPADTSVTLNFEGVKGITLKDARRERDKKRKRRE